MSDDEGEDTEGQSSMGSRGVCTDSYEDPVAVYRRRWCMLTFMCFFTGLSAHNSIYFAAIPDVLVKYYNLSSEKLVDILSLVYLVIYVPCIFPAIWLLENKGLRPTLLVGTLGTTIGAWIKVVIFGQSYYWALIVGQTITAICQVTFLSIPAPLAATWFPDNEVATATGFGVFGNMLGASLGFLLTPILVPYVDDMKSMGWYLRLMLIEVAVVSTVFFVLTVFCFQNKPPRPPSLAQYALVDCEPYSMRESLGVLLKDNNFRLLLVSFGISWGALNCIAILLGQIVQASYENAHEHTGYLGLTMTASGLPSILLYGFILDKTKRFKVIISISYILMLMSSVIYTFTMGIGKIWVAYISAALLGFFMIGYLPVGMEFAAEVMYPEPENYTSAMLYSSSMILGAIFVLCSEQIKPLSILGANLFITCTFVIGAIVTLFLKENLKRHSKSQGLKASSNEQETKELPDNGGSLEDTGSDESIDSSVSQRLTRKLTKGYSSTNSVYKRIE